MTEVIVLVEGYAYMKNDVMHASPTSTLIIENNKKILVDPGTNKEKLLAALDENNIKLEDIDTIFLTHYHPDHFLNISLFPDASVYDGTYCWEKDAEYIYKNKIPGTEIQVIATPGHADEHASLLVETEEGKVCIAGDVIWWRDDEVPQYDELSIINHEDAYANNPSALKESRKNIIKLADIIIPGHGKKFRVKIIS